MFTPRISYLLEVYRHLLKTPLKKRWFRAGLACLILTASAGAGYGQITNWVGIFNSSADTALWTHVAGDANTVYFLAGDAPAGGPSTGCMVFQSIYGPGLAWSGIGKNVRNLNASNCTALELDVKVDPSCGFDTFGNACNSFEVTISYGSSQTWAGTDTGAIAPVAGNNGWQHIVVPASQLGGSANWSNIQYVIIDPDDGYYSTAANMVLRIANVKLTAPAPLPASPTISINASNAVRTADVRWFGINTGDWDNDFNLQYTVPELTKAGWQTLRFPGGSDSDNYHWYPNRYDNYSSYQGNNSFSGFAQVATNIGATVIITANYGTGTAAEAAAWVAWSNVTNHYGFKYWEIGNEQYSPMTETDNNTPAHDPYTYATRAVDYIQQMKAVDPTIKVGVVVVVGEELDSNGYTNHPATNLVTGQVFHGWTPVVLSTLRQLGVTPDFAIYHFYPENAPSTPDNDQTLLAGTGRWAGDAAELRGDITDFFGPSGTNIELLITENNSDEGNPGKQSVSLVNGLYYADSLGQLMKTEINGLVWWHLRDGGPEAVNGSMSSSLYGWRMYGGFGVMAYGDGQQTGLQLTNRYPPYFTAELISHFIRAGDTVLNASSDHPLVSAYAALRTNGSLTLMAINKSSASNYPVNIVLTNYVPSGTATIYSYGMPQDNAAAAANNSSCDIATNFYGVSTNFNYTLAPYSVTVFAFVPASTPAQIGGISVSGTQFVFSYPTVSGQTYQLQYITDLSSGAWLPAGGPVLGTGAPVSATNSIGSSMQMFFRLSITP